MRKNSRSTMVPGEKEELRADMVKTARTAWDAIYQLQLVFAWVALAILVMAISAIPIMFSAINTLEGIPQAAALAQELKKFLPIFFIIDIFVLVVTAIACLVIVSVKELVGEVIEAQNKYLYDN